VVGKLSATSASEREEGSRCTSKERFPPPLSEGQPPPLWPKLPLANRHRLLWLLSRLLERRLEGVATPEEEEEVHRNDPGGRL
jgi:hypothetical protein